MQEMQKKRGQSLGWEDPLKEESATHSSNPAWEIPWTEDSGELQSMGSQGAGHNQACTHTYSTTWTSETTKDLFIQKKHVQIL